MRFGKLRHRAVFLLALAALVVALGLMLSNLLRQLDRLSAADQDNTQWRITQLDTEFANLNATLADQLRSETPDSEQIRLRLDIALSRLIVISAGNTQGLFEDNAEAAQLAAEISQFEDRAIAISEQPGDLSKESIQTLRDLTQDVRPAVRRMALIGVTKGAELSTERRANFAQQLLWTGAVAIGLMVIMAALLFVLGVLMQRAQQRDRELLASSKQLASTVAASLDAIVTADEQGKIIGFNAAAEDVFGWDRDVIIGRKMDETFIPHRMRETHQLGMKRYLETRVPHVVDGGRVELAALRKSGEEFPVELNITSVSDGENTKFIAYIRDISERKINEQKLIDAKDRAERMDRAKSQFLTVMSHEMRTPLNGVLGVLELLMQTKLTARQERYAKIAMASSEILLEHTNEALDITRIETGTLQLAKQDFDLPRMMRDLRDVLEPLAQEKGLGLNVEVDDDVGKHFHGDRNRLRQILTNLIGNAVKFTDSGRIELRVSGIHGKAHSSLKFAVKDTGAGIAEEFQEQIFEDFVALAHSEGRQRRGDGLGLSISRKIARQMGGDITLESEVGRGSTFTLTVPFERSQGGTLPSSEKHALPTVMTKSLDILVVEDNDINRSVLRDMLENMGHTVVEAENGAVCVEKAAAQRFDAIFMDISMPVMDGIEATQILGDDIDGQNAATPIFGLTAHGREEYRDQALAAGMTRLYTKPIRMDALSSILAGLDTEEHRDHEARDVDVLTDLLDTLGAEKTQQAGDKFFGELAALIAAMQKGRESQLVEEVHKVKGAAALLGFSDIAAPLQTLEATLRSGQPVDISERAEILNALSKRTQAWFTTTVEKRGR